MHSKSNAATRRLFGQRFRIDNDTDCWIWTACCGPNGYGAMQAHVDGVSAMWRAHRLSWRLYRGPIPAGMLVCHACDTPRCVNPAHLFLGTNLDNKRDSQAKGRSRVGRAPRRRRPNHRLRLNAEAVKVIRFLVGRGTHNCLQIAEAYGVSRQLVNHAAIGDTWMDVDFPPVNRRQYVRNGERRALRE